MDTWGVYVEIKPTMVLTERGKEYDRAKYWQREMDGNGLELVIMFGTPNRDIVLAMEGHGPADEGHPLTCRHCEGLCYYSKDLSCYGDIGRHSDICFSRDTYLDPEHDERMIAAKRAVEKERFGESTRRANG